VYGWGFDDFVVDFDLEISQDHRRVAPFLRPWHRRVHRLTSFILDRVALREKAVVAIAVTVSIAVVAFLSLIPSLVK